MPGSTGEQVSSLATQASRALNRASKAPAGDRSEALLFEVTMAAIEQAALGALYSGSDHIEAEAQLIDAKVPTVLTPGMRVAPETPSEVKRWLESGATVVELALPHFGGETARPIVTTSSPVPAAERWQSAALDAREAVHARFTHVVETALAASRSEARVIRPSGVSNAVLTEGLRRFAAAAPGVSPVDVEVEYRDGSRGPPFTLRSIALRDQLAPNEWKTLKFALLSIRHVELDELVDGAWLRNSRISRRRPMGNTDAIAFEISRRQLRSLSAGRPTFIHIYQTGLEPAIVGFYRALVLHLREYPHSVAVLPRYFGGQGVYTDGTIWAT